MLVPIAFELNTLGSFAHVLGEGTDYEAGLINLLESLRDPAAHETVFSDVR
ncbi:hypothetical protein [Pseudomonas vancouverensis]|uniref:hypothetical protein n=1 Tax=Pseudomonas vancouverensis TaxID=95300 RepID=UPI0012FE4596|nr:hypothetical protein [Pseudomonas vancouverensis]